MGARSDRNGYGDEVTPVKGMVYTVRCYADYQYPETGEALIFLEEIINRPRLYQTFSGPQTVEPAFQAARFRPVKTTDISIFEAMLRPTKQEEKVK